MSRINSITLLFSICLVLFGCETTVLESLETGTVKIQFSLERESYVIVEIKNRYNSVVRSFDEGIIPPGQHEIIWDTTDNNGDRIFEGIYFIFIFVDGELLTPEKRVVLLNP